MFQSYLIYRNKYPDLTFEELVNNFVRENKTDKCIFLDFDSHLKVDLLQKYINGTLGKTSDITIQIFKLVSELWPEYSVERLQSPEQNEKIHQCIQKIKIDMLELEKNNMLETHKYVLPFLSLLGQRGLALKQKLIKGYDLDLINTNGMTKDIMIGSAIFVAIISVIIAYCFA